MSLVKKPEMTEKKSAANRVNGRKTRGPTTRAGKANSGEANLRHGFYAQARDEALPALGEDPADYVRLLKSLVKDLNPREGLQAELVGRMGGALWRMKRAERIQNGLALRRVQKGLQIDQLKVGPRLIEIHGIYQRLVALGTAMNRPDYFPSAAEIHAFVTGFGTHPSDDIQKLFPLLRSFGEEAAKAPGPAIENGGREPVAPAADGQEAKSARQELDAALYEVMLHYQSVLDSLEEDFDKVRSPENIAALMAPRDQNALLMQRMEDSSLRQLWRLTNTLMKVRKNGLS